MVKLKKTNSVILSASLVVLLIAGSVYMNVSKQDKKDRSFNGNQITSSNNEKGSGVSSFSNYDQITNESYAVNESIKKVDKPLGSGQSSKKITMKKIDTSLFLTK